MVGDTTSAENAESTTAEDTTGTENLEETELTNYAQPVFYMAPGDIDRPKIVCMQEVTLANGTAAYAIGSTRMSLSDSHNPQVARRIAKQRADKAIAWFEQAGRDLDELSNNPKYQRHTHDILIVPGSKLSEFEHLVLRLGTE